MKKTIFTNSLNTIFVTLGNINPKILYKKYTKNSNVTAIICYNNADSDKKKVVGENKGKSGIYRLTNLVSRRSASFFPPHSRVGGG